MASTIVQMQLESGLSSPTITLYAAGSDSAGNTPDTLAEETNRLGLYSATVTEALSGVYYAKALSGGSLVGSGWVNLADDTGTYQVEDSYAVALRLDATVSGSTGTGARTITITVDDGSTALENANVRLTEGGNTYSGSTNASGQITFNVDDATYTVAITKVGYTYAGSSLVVSADATPTLSMTAFSPTASTAGFTTGYTYAYDEAGAVESGVTFTLYCYEAPTGSGLVLDTKTRTATSDANGLVQFTNLIKSAKYKIKRGTGGYKSFTAPTDASFAIDNFIGIDSE